MDPEESKEGEEEASKTGGAGEKGGVHTVLTYGMTSGWEVEPGAELIGETEMAIWLEQVSSHIIVVLLRLLSNG